MPRNGSPATGRDTGQDSQASEAGHVLRFRHRRSTDLPKDGPVADLRHYEQNKGPDDYRQRMTVNIAAFIFVLGLIAAGIWIADTMATMRRNQDCVLSGRRGCTPVEVEHHRW
jgi:hypothetical protein